MTITSVLISSTIHLRTATTAGRGGRLAGFTRQHAGSATDRRLLARNQRAGREQVGVEPVERDALPQDRGLDHDRMVGEVNHSRDTAALLAEAGEDAMPVPVSYGHGHLGMTLVAVTGTLIADAIVGKRASA
jgi:glycine/D-amino acid oxidase-like deaminating enzyme